MSETEGVPAAEAVSKWPIDPCTECGADLEVAGYNYVNDLSKPGTSTKVCDACDLRIWQTPIKFHFDYGLPKWVEAHMRSKRVLDRLQSWFRDAGPRCQVYFVCRANTDTVRWQYEWSEWERHKAARKPFSFRGWCGGGQIVIIVDAFGIETPESVEWLVYHELGHHEQQTRAYMSDGAWNHENRNEGRTSYEWEDDKGHEADSEERHVNRVATAYMGGKEYARPWWRPRVNAYLAGERDPSKFPDPHAG